MWWMEKNGCSERLGRRNKRGGGRGRRYNVQVKKWDEGNIVKVNMHEAEVYDREEY